MNKNVMCVTVCGDITNIGFYDVELDDISVKGIRLFKYEYKLKSSFNEIADYIYKNSESTFKKYYYGIDLIIIDCRGKGIGVVDAIEQSNKIRTPICKAQINRNIMSEALIELNDLIKNNKVSVFNDIQLDISKFELSYGANCTDVKLVDSDYISLFSNMCFVSGYSFNSLSDTYKIKSRKIVEDNLTEILCILVSDLGKANKLDVREIERLTRLIDKVNYIRGQY